MKVSRSTKYGINKRLCYLLSFLFIAIPIVVGIVVWKAMPVCETTPSAEANVDEPEITSSVPPSTCSPSVDEPWKFLRLPSYIIPVHYAINLRPDFYEDNGLFTGKETIELNITENTNYLIVHILKLSITKTAVFEKASRRAIRVKRTFEYEENQFWVVEVGETIRSGTAVDLYLEFEGSLTGSIVGFYKSTYINSVTKQKR